MRAFLGYRGVVDHQHGIAAADQPIRLNKQFRLHRPRIPDPGRNEVVQLIVFAKTQAAPPSAECSCDRQDRSAPTRRVDTFVAVPWDPTNPETASESGQALSSNPKCTRPRSRPPKPHPP